MKSKYDISKYTTIEGKYISTWHEDFLMFNNKSNKLEVSEKNKILLYIERKWVGNPDPDLYPLDFDSYLIIRINTGIAEDKEVLETVCLYEKEKFYEIFN